MNRDVIRIDYRPADDPEPFCVRVDDYGEPEIMDRLVDPDAVVIPRSVIQIRFTYPLRHEAVCRFAKDDGFTRRDLFRAVAETYREIYYQEYSDAGRTPNLPGMLNRMPSEGRYGIWGHHIGDLFLEGIVEESPGTYSLLMGS